MANRAANVRVFLDEIKNTTRGATSPFSSYYRAAGSKPGVAYEVTVNFDTGHWCDCRGNLSMKASFRKRWEKRDAHTAAHWCKHIKAVMTNPAILDAGTENRAATFVA